MFIEDIFLRLSNCGPHVFANRLSIGMYDNTIIHSIGMQLDTGVALTAKQATLAMRMLTKYKTQLTVHLGVNVQPYLDEPKYRLGVRQLNDHKYISLQDNTIQVGFSYNPQLIEVIRTYKANVHKRCGDIIWQAETKTWNFPLREDNIAFIMRELLPYEFDVDETLMQYMHDMNAITQNVDRYIPMITFDGEAFKFKNTHSAIPSPKSNDVLSALFYAKTYGVTTWDDSIVSLIDNANIDEITQSILTNVDGIISVNSELPIEVLGPAMSHVGSCLIIIPGGTELESLVTCMELLTSVGVEAHDIAVLFRIGNKSGKYFNQYVKTKSINNQISNTTRIAFVMGRLPKPLVTLQKQFDLIINLGISSPHYTLKNYIKQHHCVVNYNLTNHTGELDFGDM